MPIWLRDELVQFATDWRSDLTEDWRLALADVEPCASAVCSKLTYTPEKPIYPSRRSRPLEKARDDAHVFRALDELSPARVRCVLLGQDPYPYICQATGRSFEQGEASTWQTLKSTPSLSGLVRHLAEHRTGDPTFRGKGGLRRAVASSQVGLEGPRELFDRWQDAGVLCLNTGLTLTHYVKGGAPEQLDGHIPFWTPVVQGIMRHLAGCGDDGLVFLLLGKTAREAADTSGIRQAADASGSWQSRVTEVRLNHPAYTAPGPNPFSEVNAALRKMGFAPIEW